VGEEVAELSGDEGRDVVGRCSHGCVAIGSSVTVASALCRGN